MRARAVLSALSCAALATAAGALPAHAVPRARVGLPAGVKPTDTVELANGQKVPAAQVQKELDDLQEAFEKGGFSLRKSDARAPKGKQLAFPGQDREAAEDKAAFSERVGKMRARQAAGFKELVRARPVRPLPSGGTSRSASRPEPKEDPLALTYEEALGKKDKAAIYVAFGLEDKGDAEHVGCSGGLEGGVYLFSERRPLVKAVLEGASTGAALTGKMELYLVGKMVDGFPKTGSQKLPELKKAISPPEIAYGYGFDPITIKVTAAVSGELGVALASTQTKAGGGAKGSCSVGVTPYVRGAARATASVAAVAYKVGVEGNVTLLDLRLPATATIALQDSPLALREDFSVAIDTKFLDGDLGFFVQTNVPRQGEKLWDIDWDTIYRKTFFSWDGFTAKETLASFQARQTLFQ